MKIQPQLYLAPFQGITGVTFRTIYTKHFRGIDKLFTPFFTGIKNDSKLSARKASELGKPFENSVEVVPQILSKDASEIIRFAHICHQLGFKELNWNLGCPYPQVANKKRGSGMLPYPSMIDEILEKTMVNMPIKFSIKCRFGYEMTDEIYKVIPVLNRYNISELTIHARIGKQLYTGEPDHDTFQKAISLLSIPVVYNGDIFNKDDFESVNHRFTMINNWMIGRGLLSDPFLPSTIKNLHITQTHQLKIHQFVEDLYLAYRKQMNDHLAAIGVMKEYWQYLSTSFNDPHRVFKKLKKVNGFDEYEEAVAFVFREYEWVGSAKP